MHERNLWEDLKEAAAFFKLFLDADVPRIAVENPVMPGHARELIGRGPDFCVQPWQFGEPFVKRTCFWTKGLPPLQPTNIVEGRHPAVWLASPSPNRWKERSRTYQGIADAMANQWGTDMTNPYQNESKTLAEIWERGRQDRANGATWESRPKYTSFAAMVAYMQGGWDA